VPIELGDDLLGGHRLGHGASVSIVWFWFV